MRTQPLSPLPPTSRLPPISQIHSCSGDDLRGALAFIRLVYCPEVRGSRCRHSLDKLHNHNLDQPNQLACTPEIYDEKLCLDEDTKNHLRSDAFERSYTIKWLMALVAQVEALDSREPQTNTFSLSIQHGADIINEAASILALCAGTASAGTITRTFAFPVGTKNLSSVIKVRLTDVPLDNCDYSSVGAQTWGGACVLAERIVRYPEYFGLVGQDSIQNLDHALRILELGAGTGLVSLALAKLLKSAPDWTNRRTEIVATDFYPPVLENLQNNITSNMETTENEQPQLSVSIVSHFLDWKTFSATSDAPPAPFDLPFDLILGADIIYEAEHAFWIKGCLGKLLRKPQVSEADEGGIFHLVIPLRRTHQAESSTVTRVFPEILTSGPSRGVQELCILSKEVIVCDTCEDDQEDNVEYAYYRIAWR